MSDIAYKILIHVLTLCVFTTFWISLHRQLKAGIPLSELKTFIFGLVVFGGWTVYTAGIVILTLMPRSF